MGATPTNQENSENVDSPNSTCMKLIQLWLTSFAIGIPTLRLLYFFDFRVMFRQRKMFILKSILLTPCLQNSEIIIAVFLTMLIFGTMYILDEDDRLWRVDDDQPCNEVADVERLNISSNYRSKKFEVKFCMIF